jgi:hypothetical protein
MRLDSGWLQIFSELFVNLAAGWWGAALIAPNLSDKSTKAKLVALTFNLF